MWRSLKISLQDRVQLRLVEQIQSVILPLLSPPERPSDRPPLLPERVAERLARIDALLAQVSLDEEEEVMEDMNLDAQPSRFQASFRPTRYCQHFFVGQCWVGSSCTFAHAYDELHPASQ